MALPDPFAFAHLATLPGLAHGVFSGLNIGMNCGDDPADVSSNRSRMLAALGFSQAVFLNQVHGNDILVLKKGRDVENLLWNPVTGKTRDPVSADAVVTDIEDLALVIQVADCQAVILYDPVKRVAANVHSGWRGSVTNILGLCVDLMVQEFGCRPEHIRAGISPSLGPCCAEFINYRSEIPEPMWKYRLDSRNHFNFWEMSRDQMVERGMNPDDILTAGKCTKCNADIYFSYRASRITGRFGAVVGLVPNG